MNLKGIFGPEVPHVVAAIGSGGKSTFVRGLADELARTGATVVLATTTHFLPFEGVETLLSPTVEEARAAAEARGVVCVAGRATGDPGGRKLAAPAGGVEKYAGAADHLLVEADGSKRLPLKVHATWEPVVPAGALRVLVVGASGFGRPVAEAVHRPEIFCELAGCSATDDATPRLVARVVASEALADVVVVNQAETPERAALAREFARELAGAGCDTPVYLGSIRDHRLQRA